MSSAPFELGFPSDHVLEGLAREVISHASADRHLADRQRALELTLKERLRLARELHDGLLQVLTGVTLQLEAVLPLVQSDPDSAYVQLREIQNLIVDRQRELREWVDGVRHANDRLAPRSQLATVLDTLCVRVSQWGPRVELVANELASMPGYIADQVHRIVQEALSNITRHARAREARIEVRTRDQVVRIVIVDDGCGFPFRGRYDLAALEARRLGPRSLKERVASLGGTLVLTSTLSGSTLEIELPLRERRRTSRSPNTVNNIHQLLA
jgi:signal transduction histidine kinase